MKTGGYGGRQDDVVSESSIQILIYMRLFMCSMQFNGASKVRGTDGGVILVKQLVTSAHCGLPSLASGHSQRSRYFPLFRRKSFARPGSMTGSRDSIYRRNRRNYCGVTNSSIKLKSLMKSETIGEEDTTADPAVCEH
ncbi:hypothetical protein ANTPLA_LOCUS6377 [Anthophora plagiata]